MNLFTVVLFDHETHGTFSDAAHSDGAFHSIARIDEQTTWRELRLIAQTVRKTEEVFDGKGVTGLMVINGTDTTAFALQRLIDAYPKTDTKDPQPQAVAEEVYLERTTINVVLTNVELRALMQLLPLGNSSHSGVREKLHQASLALDKKR